MNTLSVFASEGSDVILVVEQLFYALARDESESAGHEQLNRCGAKIESATALIELIVLQPKMLQ